MRLVKFLSVLEVLISLSVENRHSSYHPMLYPHLTLRLSSEENSNTNRNIKCIQKY